MKGKKNEGTEEKKGRNVAVSEKRGYVRPEGSVTVRDGKLSVKQERKKEK